jgi:hypothetical protein
MDSASAYNEDAYCFVGLLVVDGGDEMANYWSAGKEVVREERVLYVHDR